MAKPRHLSSLDPQLSTSRLFTRDREKAGPGGAIFAAIIAYWMFKVLWLGGV